VAIGRLFQRKLQDRLLNALFHTILRQWFLAANLLQSQLSALLIQLGETIEAVSRIAAALRAPGLTGLADVAQLLRQFEQSYLILDNLLIGCHS
jgi:hypothetical protein